MSTSDESEQGLTSSYRFRKGDRHSDIILLIENRRLHVHKTLLVLHSRVFETLITDYSNEIPLTGRSYEAMVGVLEQIYPGESLDLFRDDDIEEVLQLAHVYEVHQVFINFRHYVEKRLCEESDKQLSTDSILLYLRQVELFEQLHPVRARIVRRVSQMPVEEMEKSEFFRMVPATAIRDALLLQIKSRTAGAS